jgi:hypothetical protein
LDGWKSDGKSDRDERWVCRNDGRWTRIDVATGI